MTIQERAEVEVLKAEMKRANDDIREMRTDVKVGFEQLSNKIDNLPNIFITRREGAVIRTLIGILLAGLSALAALVIAGKH